VLTQLGLAREVVETDQLALIEEALTALAASLDGDYDANQYFCDLQRP
jgi:hydrogenase expression/formation protein HypC